MVHIAHEAVVHGIITRIHRRRHGRTPGVTLVDRVLQLAADSRAVGFQQLLRTAGIGQSGIGRRCRQSGRRFLYPYRYHLAREVAMVSIA